jgi:hypothetical protein
MEPLTNKSKFDKILHKIGIVFIYVLLVYMPFYELVLHFLQSYTHLPESQLFWITHFYEPFIVLFLLIYLIKFALERKLPKLQRVDLYVSIFLGLAIVAVAFRYKDLSRGLEGLRFLALPYAIYLVSRLIDYKNPRKLIQLYVIIASVFAALGVVEYFFLPKGYMDIYYKIADFGFGQNGLITVSQATAFLAGPNQLASYLILPFFYLLHRFFASKKNVLKEYDNILLIIVTIAIGLTYSRSALIGLFVGAIGMFIYFGKAQRDKIIYTILFLVVAVTLAFSYAMMNGELLRDLLTHGSSWSQHLQATSTSFKQFFDGGILKIIFGFGVGSAGPTALKLGGVISENYYLQVVFELGILGIAIYIAFLAGLLKKLYTGSKTMFFAFIALLVNAFFLHIFADNPAMAVTVFIIIASIMNVEHVQQESAAE